MHARSPGQGLKFSYWQLRQLAVLRLKLLVYAALLLVYEVYAALRYWYMRP